MRFIFTSIILTLSCSFLHSQQSSFSGKVLEKATKEPILFGTVAIYKDEILLTGTDTDYDGNFYIKVEPGKYKVEAKYLGMKDLELEILIEKGKNLEMTIEMIEGPIMICCLCGCGTNRMPLVNIADPFSGQTFMPSNGFLRPNVGSRF